MSYLCYQLSWLYNDALDIFWYAVEDTTQQAGDKPQSGLVCAWMGQENSAVGE